MDSKVAIHYKPPYPTRILTISLEGVLRDTPFPLMRLEGQIHLVDLDFFTGFVT